MPYGTGAAFESGGFGAASALSQEAFPVISLDRLEEHTVPRERHPCIDISRLRREEVHSCCLPIVIAVVDGEGLSEGPSQGESERVRVSDSERGWVCSF